MSILEHSSGVGSEDDEPVKDWVYVEEHRYESPIPPHCPCYEIGWVVQEHELTRVDSTLARRGKAKRKERLIDWLADAQGWDTLRGHQGRRALLEELLEAVEDFHPPRGRPRSVWVTQFMKDLVRQFIVHAREAGGQHVLENLALQEVLLVEADAASGSVERVEGLSLLELEGADEALEVVERATRVQLTDGRFEYELDSLTRRFLAALLGCSQDSLRDPLPSFEELVDDRSVQSNLGAFLLWLWLKGMIHDKEAGITEPLDLDRFLQEERGEVNGQDIAKEANREELERIARRLGGSVDDLLARVEEA